MEGGTYSVNGCFAHFTRTANPSKRTKMKSQELWKHFQRIYIFKDPIRWINIGGVNFLLYKMVSQDNGFIKC